MSRDFSLFLCFCLHFFYLLQNISPGLVATDFMASYSMFSPEAMAVMPTLDPNDVAAAAIYVLSNPPHVLVRRLYMHKSLKHSLILCERKLKNLQINWENNLPPADTRYRAETSGRIMVINFQVNYMHYTMNYIYNLVCFYESGTNKKSGFTLILLPFPISNRMNHPVS